MQGTFGWEIADGARLGTTFLSSVPGVGKDMMVERTLSRTQTITRKQVHELSATMKKGSNTTGSVSAKLCGFGGECKHTRFKDMANTAMQNEMDESTVTETKVDKFTYTLQEGVQYVVRKVDVRTVLHAHCTVACGRCGAEYILRWQCPGGTASFEELVERPAAA